MSISSKLKETLVCLGAGKVTMPYPYQAKAVPERFRGRPLWDGSKCIGCGGCSNNCPSREILLFDPCQEVRILKYAGRRCTFCGRCAELCPEKAITMSGQFETATNAISDLGQKLDLFMSTCQRCGRCFDEPTNTQRNALDKLKMKGYRFDKLEEDRWVFKSKAYLEGQAETEDVAIDLEG